MVTFKALKSWLTSKASNKAPTGWLQTRQAILTRLEERTKSPLGEEAPIEEIPYETETAPNEELAPQPLAPRGQLNPSN